MRGWRLHRWQQLKPARGATRVRHAQVDAPFSTSAALRDVLESWWRGFDLRSVGRVLLFATSAICTLVALLAVLILIPQSARVYAPVEIVWLEAEALPRDATEVAKVVAAEPALTPEPFEADPAPIGMDRAPALPSTTYAQGGSWHSQNLPPVSARPDPALLALDALSTPRTAAPLPASSGNTATGARAALPSWVSNGPPAAPAGPASIAQAAVAARPPEPEGESRGESGDIRPGLLQGVPLASLAACESNEREDRLKQRILASVRSTRACESEAGTYHFLQTNNLNAFLMWIEKAPSRHSRNRCGELDLALACLGANQLKEIGS